MRYVVLMYSDPAQKAIPPAELDEVGSKHRALRTELTVSGELVGGESMAYPEDTVTLRLTGKDSAITHGPLLASGEQLTAYYVLDCEDLARVISIADRILDFHVTAVEVRQAHDSVG